MAKVNEQIEDMLDVQDDHEKRIKATEEQLPKLIELLDAVQKKLAEKPATQPVQQVAAKVKVEYDDLKDSVYDGIADYYKKNPTVFTDLTENNGSKIASIFEREYCKKWKERMDQVEEERKLSDIQDEQMLDDKRRIQGFMNFEQMKEWAPEYSDEVLRIVRYIGDRTIGHDEPPEKAHAILKVMADVAAGAFRKPEIPPPPPPTLSAWLSYRWNKFKESTDKWGALKWGFLISLTCSIFICISLYQDRVMELDRTNRLFYRQVMQTEEGRMQYHELDSLIHADSFFKTYRTLDSE